MRYSTACFAHSRLAYEPEATIRRKIENSGGSILSWLTDQRTGTFGYIAHTASGATFVVFRGSQFEINDWKTNLDRAPVMGLHNGFYNALQSIVRQLRNTIASHDHPDALIVTGHSLGGALATLAANELSENHFVDEVHTFGAPRIGTARFRRLYDATLGDVTYRHVNCCDIVPRLPSAVRYGYEHVGNEIYYDVFGRQLTDATPFYRLRDRIMGRIAHGFKLPSRGITDHRLTSYGKVIK